MSSQYTTNFSNKQLEDQNDSGSATLGEPNMNEQN
jgi:hypothetical protein